MEESEVGKRYCIKHSHMVWCFTPSETGIPYHWELAGRPAIFETNIPCFGPFVSSPPPEMTEEQWEAVLASEET